MLFLFFNNGPDQKKAIHEKVSELMCGCAESAQSKIESVMS